LKAALASPAFGTVACFSYRMALSAWRWSLPAYEADASHGVLHAQRVLKAERDDCRFAKEQQVMRKLLEIDRLNQASLVSPLRYSSSRPERCAI